MVAERDVPSRFNVFMDEQGVPQRELVDFTVLRGSEKTSVCTLDDKGAHGIPVRARGTLQIPGSKDTIQTETEDLVEWCIEYGNQPYLWVHSKNVWYRLGDPAPEYAKTHDLALRRFQLCARLYILATTMEPEAATFKSFASLLSGEWSGMRAFKEKDIIAEREFVLAQVKNLNEETLNRCRFFHELRARKPSSGATAGTSASAKTKRKKAAAASATPPQSSGAALEGSPSTANAKQSTPWVPNPELDKTASERLLKRMDKVLASVMKMKNAYPFVVPVNPERDGCPDYLERVKKPMDYGTIKSRLESGFYEDALRVVMDARQVAKNCLIYNGPNHDFTRYAKELSRKFEHQVRAAEELELKAMHKRLASSSAGPPTSAPKRRRGDSDGPISPSSTTKGAKTTAVVKTSRKASLSKSVARDDETAEGICIASVNGAACGKRTRPESRYCSDQCGMEVARKKLKTLIAEGVDVDDYIRTCVGKALVGLNPLNR